MTYDANAKLYETKMIENYNKITKRIASVSSQNVKMM